MTVNPQFTDYQSVPTDAELFVQDHFDRFKAWLTWSAPGGLAQISLAENDGLYDQFAPPEIAALIGRITAPFELTFVKVSDGQCVCLVDAIKLFELMEAVKG